MRGSAPLDVDGDGMAGTQVTVMLMHMLPCSAANGTAIQARQQPPHPSLAHTARGHRLHPPTHAHTPVLTTTRVPVSAGLGKVKVASLPTTSRSLPHISAHGEPSAMHMSPKCVSLST